MRGAPIGGRDVVGAGARLDGGAGEGVAKARSAGNVPDLGGGPGGRDLAAASAGAWLGLEASGAEGGGRTTIGAGAVKPGMAAMVAGDVDGPPRTEAGGASMLTLLGPVASFGSDAFSTSGAAPRGFDCGPTSETVVSQSSITESFAAGASPELLASP